MQEKLEMINVNQTFVRPLRAAYLHEWLCNSHNVSASLQHLMAGSTCWLLTAVNMYICILVWMLPASLPAVITPSLPFLRQVLQSLCLPAPHHRRLKDSFFPQSWFLPKMWVSKQGSWRHSQNGPCSDVPLQWNSLCPCRSQQGFLHHLYTRGQHVMLLCSWAGFSETNMQQPVEFSHYKQEKSALPVESLFVHILTTAYPPEPSAPLFGFKGALVF